MDRLSKEYAESLDEKDDLSGFRANFHIPSVNDLQRETLKRPLHEKASDSCIYLCGNSLGLQPTRTAQRIDTFLTQWRTKGVLGHLFHHHDSDLVPFLDIDDQTAKLMAPVVGALESEVAVMGTLTGNLHLMMSSFYRPSKKGQGKWKVMLEGKAFPSDHFAIESQIALHDLDPKDSMVFLEPTDPINPILTTSQILQKIDEHASELALILLPGIQFYTGQYFDIATITAHAHSHDILIGWDCAHAAGNVDLKLHDWNVDFAVWCTYKYLNSGPGAMAAIFVHQRHGIVDMGKREQKYQPRLSGWWGDTKSDRFKMTNNFVPRPGAAGFQLSNPSALDSAAVVASLEIFSEASISSIRKKSKALTVYLEFLLDETFEKNQRTFSIITPRNVEERGAQLSIRLAPGLLDPIMEHLEAGGFIVDERRPDVIRIAPAPLYNTFMDVWQFCQTFKKICQRIVTHFGDNGE